MMKITNLASFLIVLFYLITISYNSNYHLQFAQLNLVKKWARTASARSGVTPCQDPDGNAPPWSKIFSWKPNCQIRLIKLYYQIILFSPTVHTNLNSIHKTRLKSHKVNQKAKTNLDINLEMPHLNKNKKQMERRHKRHPQSEIPISENKLNKLIKSHSLSHQNSFIIAGPLQAAQEANPSNKAIEFIRAAAIQAESATGEPWEATQQASNQRGNISAYVKCGFNSQCKNACGC